MKSRRLMVLITLAMLARATATLAECPAKIRATIPLPFVKAQAVGVVSKVAYVYSDEAAFALDIRHPDTPELIAQGPGLSAGVKDILAIGDLLIVSGPSGLSLLDHAEPGVLVPTPVYNSTVPMTDLEATGNRLYVTTITAEWIHGLVTFDMSDPRNPILLGQYTFPSYQMAYQPVALGDKGLVLNAFGNIISYDVRDPNLPITMAKVQLPNFKAAAYMASSGNSVMCSSSLYGQISLYAYDWRDLAKPVLTGSTIVEGPSGSATMFADNLSVFMPNLSKNLGRVYRLRSDGLWRLTSMIDLPKPPATSGVQRASSKEGLLVYACCGQVMLINLGHCPADLDCSYGLDINDFIAFQTAFVLGDATADCDENGSLTIDDFVCFQTAFAAGC